MSEKPSTQSEERRRRLLRRRKFVWEEGDLRSEDPALDRLLNPSLYKDEPAPDQPQQDKPKD